MIAAVGWAVDCIGSKRIVWGVGRTVKEAREDARGWIEPHGDVDALTFELVTDAYAEAFKRVANR